MTPFRLLTRQFFAGFFRSELLSEAGVESYRTWLISVGAMLLTLPMLAGQILMKKYGYVRSLNDPGPFSSVFAADECFVFSAMFLGIAFVSTLQWQSLFPGSTDFHILSPLPLRRSEIFLARSIALGLFLGIFLLGVLPLPLLLSAMVAAPLAFLATGLAAGVHAFLSVLALQGLCLTLLPHRSRSAASHLLQAVLLICLIALVPVVIHVPGLHRLLDGRAEWLLWIPSMWWLGFCEALRGSADPWYNALAQRAITALFLAAAVAAATYLLPSRRFSDFAAPPRETASRPSLLLQLARRDDRGALAFLAWTLARSPQHRLLLLAIGGIGASFALDGFTSAFLQRWMKGGAIDAALARSSLALPLLLTFTLTAALRVIYRIPFQWPAHWPFRITEEPLSRPRQLESILTGFYWIAAVPSLLVAFPFQCGTLGWERALAAQPLLLGWTICLIEFVNQRWDRLPFTATFAPSHRPAGIVLVLFLLTLSIYSFAGSELVRNAIFRPRAWIAMAAVLLALWAWLRARRLSNWGGEPLQFSDDADPAVLVTRFAPE